MMNDDNKNKTVDFKLVHPSFKNRSGFILYYSPGCPHCVNFKPTYQELAKRLKGSTSLGAINCSDVSNGNDMLSDFFKISGYPTLKFYDGVEGKYIDYTGGRNVTDMLSFLCRVKNICGLDK